MARPPKLPITKAPSGKWRYDLPAAMSPTGKRARKTFDTQAKAKLSRDADLKRHTLYGAEAHAVSASVATDAAKAVELLEGSGMSLVAVAKDWLERKAEADASCLFSELFDEYRAEKVSEGISSLYLRDIDKFFAPLLSTFGQKIVAHLGHKEIKEAMQDAFKTSRQRANAYRTIRPAFSIAVTSGYCSENPFDKIKVPKHNSGSPEALSVAEVKSVFNACTDNREADKLIKDYQLDCRGCTPAFALMVFAGIRPEEISRLQWEAVHLDDAVIIIDKSVAKTRSHRIIPIESNLQAWLETVPKKERTGSVTPSNWKKKYQCVRHVSKISKRQQDILRHTFASAHLAAFSDFGTLQSAMGHGTSEMILKHYKALMRKPTAVKFWSIRPESTAAQMEAVA